MKYFYSVVIPVYNRPEEVAELLQSLTQQTYQNFEVLIVEDGSSKKCDAVAKTIEDQLNIRYFFKENTGQGFSRNFGFDKAKGDYFIVFDSDCIVPPHYFQAVEDHLTREPLDAFGGPDRAMDSFTTTQKAINFAMTSFLTTGGIRGGKVRTADFHPRSFNMGISRQVYEATGGYIITRMGEDIEFSIRIIRSGFKAGLIPEAFVYHKRRTAMGQFFRQLHFFGRARVNVGRFFADQIKLTHLFPVFFFLGLVLAPLLYLIDLRLVYMAYGLYLFYGLLVWVLALITTRSLPVASKAVWAAFTMLIAYGLGFLSELLKGKGQ